MAANFTATEATSTMELQRRSPRADRGGMEPQDASGLNDRLMAWWDRHPHVRSAFVGQWRDKVTPIFESLNRAHAAAFELFGPTSEPIKIREIQRPD